MSSPVRRIARKRDVVIPGTPDRAQAGIYFWVPIFMGMTAFAGMTVYAAMTSPLARGPAYRG